MLKLLEILEMLGEWADDIKPVEQEQRFGNKAFRAWHEKLTGSSEAFLSDLTCGHVEATKEIQVYLHDSFGNPTRIDYGTGHEMAFVMFLACLFHVDGILDVKRDAPAVGLVVFAKYMDLARKLQTTYRMEPAGSQGVWSLDDFQFVSFIWGAAQFMDDESTVSPKDISDYDKAEELRDDYHFFACIHYISRVKSGPFAEHSNQLWNVSGVPLWSKVYLGLIKMYRAEVISKFPVIQHTYFGSVFRLEQAKDQRATAKLQQTRRPPPPPPTARMPPPTINFIAK